MTALASYVPSAFQQGDNRAVTVGIQPESKKAIPLNACRSDSIARRRRKSAMRSMLTMQSRSRTTAIRAGRDLVDKIENTELRKSVKAYTDFQLVQLAVRKKDSRR